MVIFFRLVVWRTVGETRAKRREPRDAANAQGNTRRHPSRDPPSDTVARMRPVLREMGVTRVANVTGLDVVGIPTVLVVRPNARSLSVTQGKGASLEAAKASGIMECLEHYLAERIDFR